jgi:hypothetical protein
MLGFILLDGIGIMAIIMIGFLWIMGDETKMSFYGKVWGDFKNKVYADTEEGFNHFYKNHPPKTWDYQDI